MANVQAYSPEAAVGVAKAGIDYIRENFQFIDPNVDIMLKMKDPKLAIKKFKDHMDRGDFKPFNTVKINGTRTSEPKPIFTVPYKGVNISSSKLKEQLMNWASYGTIEPDAAESIAKAVTEKLLDLTGMHFVLIGAGKQLIVLNKMLYVNNDKVFSNMYRLSNGTFG